MADRRSDGGGRGWGGGQKTNRHPQTPNPNPNPTLTPHTHRQVTRANGENAPALQVLHASGVYQKSLCCLMELSTLPLAHVLRAHYATLLVKVRRTRGGEGGQDAIPQTHLPSHHSSPS